MLKSVAGTIFVLGAQATTSMLALMGCSYWWMQYLKKKGYFKS